MYVESIVHVTCIMRFIHIFACASDKAIFLHVILVFDKLRFLNNNTSQLRIMKLLAFILFLFYINAASGRSLESHLKALAHTMINVISF